jgi:hypothetical protein
MPRFLDGEGLVEQTAELIDKGGSALAQPEIASTARVTANFKKRGGYQSLKDGRGYPDNQLRRVLFFQDGIVAAARDGVYTGMGRTIQQYLGMMIATFMRMGRLACTIQQDRMFVVCHRHDTGHPQQG